MQNPLVGAFCSHYIVRMFYRAIDTKALDKMGVYGVIVAM